MATRPLESDEYIKVIETMMEGGFKYPALNSRKEPVERLFKPNIQVAMILQLQASLGLRIGDVLNLTVGSFRNGRLEIRERKTDKLQYREIHSGVHNAVLEYAVTRRVDKEEKLFRIGVRSVQKQLKIVTDYLGLENISTHSFRKLYAVQVYENNDRDIYLLKELLNHASIATTQRYIRVSQKAMNKASSQVNNIIASGIK